MRFLIALLAAILVATSAQATTTRTARVSVPTLSPFTVVGSRFLPQERVRVLVKVKDSYVHRLRAGPRGRFTTRFLSVKADSCTPYYVRATGSRGSVAVLKVMPECPPPAPIG